MREIPGTITDRAMDARVPQATRLEDIPTNTDEPLTLDQYQDLAASTAVYPRVYTEQQVVEMLTAIFVLYEMTYDEEIEQFIQQTLDHFETPFNRLVYPVLGLLGEAGEVANKLKKVARDDQGQMDLDKSDEIAAEMGDVTWYVAAVARELGAKLGDIAQSNLNKLFSRKERGVLGGSGDNR